MSMTVNSFQELTRDLEALKKTFNPKRLDALEKRVTRNSNMLAINSKKLHRLYVYNRIIDKDLKKLEKNITVLSKGVNAYTSDILEFKNGARTAVFLTAGAASLCAIPMLILGGVAASSAGIMFSSWLFTPFPLCLIPPLMNATRDSIILTLMDLDSTLTYEQAHDMHKLVVCLSNKHPDPGHYEVTNVYVNGHWEKNKRFIKETNELKPTARFLLKKYRMEVARERIPSFDVILEPKFITKTTLVYL